MIGCLKVNMNSQEQNWIQIFCGLKVEIVIYGLSVETI